jgi:dihydroneopterin aldolase
MFTIKIKDLEAKTVLGVYDWEQKQKRVVILNIALEMDSNTVGISDEISDTVDYALVEQRILAHLEQNSYQLIEKLVADVAALVLSFDTRIAKITVEADKPGALEHARSVSVFMTVKR